jgi:uncharacterized damage-inducible protein DinB
MHIAAAEVGSVERLSSSMNKADISALIAYNFWASNRILTPCERISTDEFTCDFVPDPGWGSLRGILVHTLDTEYGWAQSCNRKTPALFWT